MKLDKDQINTVFEVVEQVLSDVFAAAKESFKQVVQEEFGEPEPFEPTKWIDAKYAPTEYDSYLVKYVTLSGVQGKTMTTFDAQGWAVGGVFQWMHIPK